MSLLFQSRPIVVIPELALSLGLTEAMLLQQIHYWRSETTSGIDIDGRRWIYNTIDEWCVQFPFFSESTIKRGFASLKAKEVLDIEQLNKRSHDRTNYYAINYDHPALNDDVKTAHSKESKRHARTGQNDLIDKRKMKRSNSSECTTLNGSNWPDLTESTTEITTEINQEISCPVALQPDASIDEAFLARHSEAVVFSAKKKVWGSRDDLTCAEWIWARVIAMYEQAAECDGEISRPKEPNWASWANEVRLMCVQDGRNHKQICQLFGKANRDPFWCKNILSPVKLREKWDDLTLKLCANPPAASVTGGHWNTPEAWENTL